MRMQCSCFVIKFLCMVAALALLSSLAGADTAKPYVDVTRVQVVAHPLELRSSRQLSAWWPGAYFRVCGPLPEGTMVYCQFSKPDGTKWIRFDYDCTDGLEADRYAEFDGISNNGSVQLDSSEGNEPQERAISEEGVYSLKIGYKSELSAVEGTLFDGRFEARRRLANEQESRFVGKHLFVVNQDWRMPFGYLYYLHRPRPMFPVYNRSADPDFEGQLGLHCQLFLPECLNRGREGLQAFLMHDGKRVPASLVLASVSGGVEETRVFIFGSVIPFEDRDLDNALDGLQEAADGYYHLSRNPGEYIIKVLLDTHVIRELPFKIEADGKVTGQGLVDCLAIGSDRTAAPVRLGAGSEMTWDPNSCRTQAFWSHPVDGLLVP